MQKIIGLNTAGKMMILLFSAVLLFHGLVLIHIIPSTIVWGGKFKSMDELRIMETISVALNLLFLFLVLVRIQIIKLKMNVVFLRIIFWIITVLFLLNTLGNCMAESVIEKIVFTPLTLLLALLGSRLALKD